MPWREVCPMDERVRLIGAVLAAEQSMRELCASFGISRKTGYKWLTRYTRQGPAGLRICHGRRWGAVGDLGATGGRDPRRAPCASELGA